jgi:hypothetical protein
MVTNTSGQPVAVAIIMPTSVQVGGRVQSWGDLYSTARITDASGHATLLRSAAKPPPSERGGEASGFSLRIIAEGYAPLECKRADFGDTPTQCVLTPGAHLTGRIIGPDGPLSAAAVELRPVVVNGDPILSRLSTRTDEAGRFTFEHAPLGAALNLCIPGWGNTQGLVAGPIKIDPLTDGQVFDALDLRADMGHRITGRIITEPGVKLPAPAWVTLARDDGCLGWAMPVQEDGSFFFSGAPFGGVYRITVFADGLMVSMKNAAASRSWTNSLRGHFKSEHTDLRVLLEPKREIPPDDAAQPRGRPLRGIEAMGAQ